MPPKKKKVPSITTKALIAEHEYNINEAIDNENSQNIKDNIGILNKYLETIPDESQYTTLRSFIDSLLERLRRAQNKLAAGEGVKKKPNDYMQTLKY